MPDVRDKLSAVGFEVVGGTPDQFAAYIQAGILKWAKVIRDAKIKVE